MSFPMNRKLFCKRDWVFRLSGSRRGSVKAESIIKLSWFISDHGQRKSGGKEWFFENLTEGCEDLDK